MNIGFVGLGEQAWDNLLPALATFPEVNIAAVCDIDEWALERTAAKFEAVPYRSYSAMLEEQDLDAVFAASSPAVHFGLLQQSIPAGIPTFVEKPPTFSTSQLEDVVALADRFGTKTRVGLNFSYSQPLQIALQATQSPEFGNLRYMRIAHLNDKPQGPLWYSDNHVRDFLLSQVIHSLGVAMTFGAPQDDDESIHFHKSTSGVLFSVGKMFTGHRSETPFSMELVASSTSPYFDWHLELISDQGCLIKVNSLQEVEFYVKGAPVSLGATPKWWRNTWRPSPVSSGHKRNGFVAQFAEFLSDEAPDPASAPTLRNCLPIYHLMDRMEVSSHDYAAV